MSDSNTYPTQKNISGIYEIYCVSNGASYVGSAVCLARRKRNHLDSLRHNRHNNIHLQRAWILYGESSFEFRVLEFCNSDLLLEREQYFINALQPEFNIAFYAGSPMKGRKHTDEVIQGIATKQRGKKFTEEHKRKIGESKIGKPRPDEMKRKISQKLIGRTLPPEHRNKIANIMKAMFSGKNNPTHKHPDKLWKGEQVNTAKLTAVDVIEIRKLYAEGISSYKLAEKFNVNPTAIQRIVAHKSWKHIP